MAESRTKMYTTDERMGKVLQRAASMKCRQNRMMTPVMGVIAVLLGVGLVGSIGYFTEWGATASVTGLYGSSLIFDSDVGGYAIVALLAAAFAAIVTLICINSSNKYAWHDPTDSADQDELYD